MIVDSLAVVFASVCVCVMFVCVCRCMCVCVCCLGVCELMCISMNDLMIMLDHKR